MARKKAAPVPAPEWSFPVEADKVGSSPLKISIKPSPEVKKLLAKRLAILDVSSLEADLKFIREPGKATIRIEGHVSAKVKQACVVSAKPVEEEIDEKFKAWFADQTKTVSLTKARHDKYLKKGNAEMPVLDESEDPESIVEGKIDAGELVTQYLSLFLNPYPHARGVKYEHGDEDEKAAKTRMDNPFAALKEWKSNKQKD